MATVLGRATEIVHFTDPLPPGTGLRDLLGGKAAGLVEMTRDLALPVPPGFVVTTDVCREYLASGWPDWLDAGLGDAIERLGTQLGLGFGDPAAPLLVSVRSGAPVSMPGMMDTCLNVGMTPAIAAAMRSADGDAAFGADCWLRFCRMYAEIVCGLPRDAVGAAAVHDDSAASRIGAAARIQQLVHEAGGDIPTDPRAQLRAATEAVFRSWTSERARLFRQREGIAEDMGTAVTVQAMVFGNRDEQSGTGVVFTRNPSTGEAAPFGDYLRCAQGEDVVAGTHVVHGLSELGAQLPGVHEELLGVLGRLERHYRDMCDVEFTVSSGRLYVLQVRVGRRAPVAAARIAVEMAEDPGFPVDRAEAVARVGHDVLAQLAEATHVDQSAVPLGHGLAASPGVGVGVLCCDPDRAAELAGEGVAVVLAREDTSPEDVHGMVNAAAIVTTRGGVVSHAAVVARSWAIPAVTSLADTRVEDGLHVAGAFVPEGAVVTVDGSHGAVYLGDCRESGEAEVPWALTIREWAAELGVEPGTRVEAGTEQDGRPVVLFELLRTVQLKGLCAVARAAAYLGSSEEAVTSCVAGAAELFKETPRGLMLTPEGRAQVAAGLAAEHAAAGSLDRCYEAFLPLNAGFKELVTWWQTEGQANAAANLPQLMGGLSPIHEALMPLLVASAEQVSRLAAYRRRFEHSLEALGGGDVSMLASPLKESYHTVWFDYHEELIALSGRNRADEET